MEEAFCIHNLHGYSSECVTVIKVFKGWYHLYTL